MAGWARSADADKTAAAKVAIAAEPIPAGIKAELVERCMRAKKADQNAPADKLVLGQLEAKKAQERCVRSLIAQHRKAKK
jgi:hypothetical protein